MVCLETCELVQPAVPSPPPVDPVNWNVSVLTVVLLGSGAGTVRSVLIQLPYFGKSPSHEELESLMPWVPDIQQDHKIPNSDAYTKCYLD